MEETVRTIRLEERALADGLVVITSPDLGGFIATTRDRAQIAEVSLVAAQALFNAYDARWRVYLSDEGWEKLVAVPA